MKILQINSVYGEKSTGKLVKQLHEGLTREGNESLVVYGRGRNVTEPGVIRLCPEWYGKGNSLISRLTGMPYGGCWLSTARLKRIILREKPDIVHLQCINGNFVNIYRLVAFLKEHKIKTVVSLHAEFMYTGNCGHAFSCSQWMDGCTRCPDFRKATRSFLFDRTGRSWQAMKQAFAGFQHDCMVCPVSPWTEGRAVQSDILKGFSFRTVWNGVDTMAIFHRGSEAAPSSREKLVLNVTAHFSPERDHPKGGWYILQLAKRMPDVTFLVAGRADPVQELPENLHLLGEITDQSELAGLYQSAGLVVLTSQRETFSMPCAESLCCGTPVVGFHAGGPEQIALPKYSEFVPWGELELLEQRLRAWLGREDLDRGEIANAARAAYSVQTMVENFLSVYRSLLWN